MQYPNKPDSEIREYSDRLTNDTSYRTSTVLSQHKQILNEKNKLRVNVGLFVSERGSFLWDINKKAKTLLSLPADSSPFVPMRISPRPAGGSWHIRGTGQYGEIYGSRRKLRIRTGTQEIQRNRPAKQATLSFCRVIPGSAWFP